MLLVDIKEYNYVNYGILMQVDFPAKLLTVEVDLHAVFVGRHIWKLEQPLLTSAIIFVQQPLEQCWW